MACDHVAARLELLEHDELLVGKGRGIDRERHFHLALGVLGLEGCGCAHGIALCVLQGLSGLGIHKGAGDGILASRGEILVGDLVLDGHGLADADGLVPVGRIGRGRADLDGQELDRLVLVLGVLMRCLDLAVQVEALEDDGLMAPEKRGVELELDLLLAAGCLGRELGRGGDLLAGDVLQRLSGLGVHEGAGELILQSLLETLVGNRVDDLGPVRCQELMVPVCGVGGSRADLDGVVVNRAAVDGVGVAAHGHFELDEVEAVVRGAAELLEGIGVIRKRALGVVNRRLRSLRSGEPQAVVDGEFRLFEGAVGVECCVVSVGVLGMRAGRGLGRQDAVSIGDGDVALSRGLGGDLEGDVREAGHILAVDLVEGDIPALHLLAHGGGVLAGLDEGRDEL